MKWTEVPMPLSVRPREEDIRLIAQVGDVALGDAGPVFDELFQPRELAASKGRSDVGEFVLEAELLDVVPPGPAGSVAVVSILRHSV